MIRFSVSEVWRSVKDYEGLYEVSNLGNVKTLDKMCGKSFRKSKVLKQQTRKGYKTVQLSKNKETKEWKVHRLVAIAFLDNKDNLPQINHIDENKSNNSIWNLEWCTSSYNINYGTRNERSSRTPVNAKKIMAYNDNEEIIFNSMLETTKHGFTRTSIYNCLNGRYEEYKGYKWRYV